MSGFDFISGAPSSPSQPQGEWTVRSPADQDHRCATVSYATTQVQRAVEAARQASRGWRSLGEGGRRQVLTRYADVLGEHQQAIASAIVHEVGKPLWEAEAEAKAMVTKVAVMLGEGAAFTRDRVIEALPGEIRHPPLGVVAVLGPFNFPGHLPNGQIVPALLTGNCVVHKPSERTPTVATIIARCLHQAGLPPGVFNLVQGPGAIGDALVRHGDVDGVLFTGSAAVGTKILAATAPTPGKLVALELGGKNASIALDDCDLERSARSIAFAAYATAGQRCSSTSRLIVERSIADALIARIADLAKHVTVGHPLGQPFMGPMISSGALERLRKAQATADANGFEPIVAGGPVEVVGHDGFYCAPALRRAGSNHSVAGYTDTELFGPDLAVHVVDDIDAAIALANDTLFGLTAAVFTSSRTRFERAAAELRCGVLHWNRPTAGASGRLPFGGIRGSGNHRPAGILAGLSCVSPQGVLLQTEPGGPQGRWPGFPDPPD